MRRDEANESTCRDMDSFTRALGASIPRTTLEVLKGPKTLDHHISTRYELVPNDSVHCDEEPTHLSLCVLGFLGKDFN